LGYNIDLVINAHSENYDENYCKQKVYDKKIRDTKDKFSIEDYEVFRNRILYFVDDFIKKNINYFVIMEIFQEQK